MVANPVDGNATISLATSGGGYAGVTASVAVSLEPMPSFGTQTVADQNYNQDLAITTLNLPEATGGDTPLTYTLTPTPPAGLIFDAANRTLTGTPTAVQAATPYTYTVTDNNGDAASLTFNITIALPPAPDAPTGLAAAGSDTKVTLTWMDPGNTSVTNYQLRYREGPTVPDTAGWQDIPGSDDTTAMHEVTGLDNGYEYAFQIRAVNAGGESDPSATVTARPSIDGRPPPATIVSVGPGTNDKDLDIVWNWSLGDSACTVNSYTIEYKRSDVSEWNDHAATDPNSPDHGVIEIYEDLGTGVTNKRSTINSQTIGHNPGEVGVSLDDASYDVRIRIWSFVCFELDQDFPDSESGRPLYLLGKPTSFTATAGDAKATLAATVAQRGPAIQKWQYTYKAGAAGTYIDWTDIADSASLSISDKDVADLTNGTTYTFKVRGVHEQGAGAESDEVTVTPVSPVNTPPTASDNTVTTVEDTAYAFDAADFNFSDVDSGDTLASVRVTGLETAGALQLSGADVTRDQVITAADIDGDNLTFTPAANANGDPYATFRFSVNDGEADSTASYTMTIDVTPVNDAPTVANAIGARSVAAGSTLTVELETDGSEVFNDADGDTLSYSATSATETAATVTVDNDADTLTLNGVAAGTSVITVTAADGNGGTVNDTFTLTVAPPTNTPPTASDNTVTTVEDTAYTFDAADFNFSDIDTGDTLASVKITGLETAGALQLSDADVTQDQVVTLADIDADNLTFTPAANANGDPYATFQFSVNDGTDDSAASYTMTIDVTAVNDAPTVANAIGARTVAAGSNLTVALETDGSEVFNDVDGDTLTYSVTSATETAATVTVDNDANTLTLAGVAAGTSVITVTAADGNGASVTDTFTLTVTSDSGPTNNPPTASDNTVTTDEDTAYIFDAADFNFSDIDTGDTLSSVKITGLETAGALQLSGADVTQDQVITAANIDADNLTFTPAANANGDPYATFRFSVNDGEADSAASYTMTIDVTAVNDAPTVANAIGARTVAAGSNLTVALETDGSEVFDDDDVDTLTYSATSATETAATVTVDNDANTLTLAGVAAGTSVITVTAADGNGASVTDTFTLTVTSDSVPTNTPPTVENAIGARSVAAGSTLTVELEADGSEVFNDVDGDTLTYSVTSATESAATVTVDNDANTLTLAGVAAGTSEITVTAADGNGGTVNDTFTVTVTAGGGTTDLTPTFGNAVVADQSYTQHTAIATLTLPRASSGGGTVTYTLSPAAPAGLTFDASARTLTGTPMQAQPAIPYTYTATDSDGDSASLTFSITVTADLTPSFDDRTIADQSYTQHTAIATLTLPRASGGDGTVTYSLSPAAPAGLTFDASAHSLTGTPTQAQPAIPYTYTATDSDGDSASLTFSITVTADLTPSFDDRTIVDQSYTRSTAIQTLTLPRASGGDGTVTYTLSPAAPAGLTFDASARSLTGTPMQAQPAIPYTYTATDSDGDSASLTFSITVTADLTPSFDDRTIVDQSYTQHTAIATLTLPRASSGDGTVTYTLSPAAPAGLTFDASARSLTGTPMQAQPAIPYTYTATDSDGDSASLTFAITVEALPVPTSPSGLVASAGDGQVSLSWADPGNGSILRYQVRYRAGSSPGSSLGPGDDGLWKDIPGSGATTTAHTVPGLTNRTQYVFQVRAVNASGAGAASAQVTAIPEGAVSLEAERQAMSMVLSEVARATLAGATEMVDERMRARPGTSTLTLAGRQVSGAGWAESALDERGAGLGEYSQRIGDADLLRGSAFTLSLSGGEEEADDAPKWTLWGRGDVRHFSGKMSRSDWDGSLVLGWVGVDVRASGQVFAGLALSQSRGEVDYRIDGEEDGTLETSLTTAWPYLQMTMGDGAEVQLLVGVGSGDAEHRSVEDEVSRAALSMTAVSLGARWPVWTRGSLTLSAVTDAGVVRLETEGSSTLVLDGLTASSWRVRGGLEVAHSGMAITGTQWRLAPRGVVTVRRDGGDGVAGTGVEVGGGVRFRGPASRFSLDASWHWLGLHSEEGVREWSARIEAELAPGAGGRGLWWTLGPRWGVEREGAMRGEDIFHQRFGTETQDGVFAGRAGYGVGTSGGLMTPFAEMEFGGGEDGVQRYGAGVEFELREGITATVRGERREATDTDSRIDLDLRVEF